MTRLGFVLLAALTASCTTLYDFDDVDVGDEGDTREPQPRTNEQFVRAIYADLLGRTPEQYDFEVTQDGEPLFALPIDEQGILVGAIDAVGDPTPVRDLIVAGVLYAPEAEVPERRDVDAEEYIPEQFRTLLGREPNVYELHAFLDAWGSDPAVGPRTVIRAIVMSREYQSR